MAGYPQPHRRRWKFVGRFGLHLGRDCARRRRSDVQVAAHRGKRVGAGSGAAVRRRANPIRAELARDAVRNDLGDRGMAEGPLAGIRVLDLSQMLSGPICGMRLGDLGADVLKIEPPGTGEWTRTHGFANAEVKGETTALLGLNRNKRSVTINLKHPDGLALFYELVKESDVFLENS